MDALMHIILVLIPVGFILAICKGVVVPGTTYADLNKQHEKLRESYKIERDEFARGISTLCVQCRVRLPRNAHYCPKCGKQKEI